MSIERSPTPPAFEAPPVAAPEAAPPSAAAPAIRLQILATEHWSLLATRSLAWNEVFARAGMYLSLLSGAIVALALVADGSRFGDAFFAFGVVILPVVLFIGVTTHLRLAAANFMDAQCVVGMNRIRAGYLTFAPDLEPYFVSGTREDLEGVSRTMAIQPGTPALVHLVAATPALVSVVNSVVAGALAAFVILLAHGSEALALLGATAGFVAAFAAGTLYGRSRMRSIQASISSRMAPPTSD